MQTEVSNLDVIDAKYSFVQKFEIGRIFEKVTAATMLRPPGALPGAHILTDVHPTNGRDYPTPYPTPLQANIHHSEIVVECMLSALSVLSFGGALFLNIW